MHRPDDHVRLHGKHDGSSDNGHQGDGFVKFFGIEAGLRCHPVDIKDVKGQYNGKSQGNTYPCQGNVSGKIFKNRILDDIFGAHK